jgi:TRAP-type C4-dicarboxylate transport system substrate-binding protein
MKMMQQRALEPRTKMAVTGAHLFFYLGKWYEVTNHLTDIGIGLLYSGERSWNLDSWNAFPDDIKKMIEDTIPDLDDKEPLLNERSHCPDHSTKSELLERTIDDKSNQTV